jgi:hypothetical protein
MYLTLVDTTINMLLAMLRTDARKEQFCSALAPTLNRCYILHNGHLLCFLGAFCVMGYIKLWTYSYDLVDESFQVVYSQDYGWLQLVGGFTGLLAFYWQVRTVSRSAQRVHDRTEEELSSEEGGRGLSTHYKWRELVTDVSIRADATAFQAGNVFYEILFSAISLKSSAANYAYFTLSVLTLVLGSVSIATATQLSFWIAELPAAKKALFAVRAIPHQVRKAPSWLRSWANFSLSKLCSNRNAWANLRLLGQPNTFLAPAAAERTVRGLALFVARQHALLLVGQVSRGPFSH